jgi:hypothetical protein
VTFAATVAGEEAGEPVAETEESHESDEQRFLRELEEATRVTAVLAVTANIEASFAAHWAALHPERVAAVPPAAAETIAAPVTAAAAAVVAVPVEAPAPVAGAPAPSASATAVTDVVQPEAAAPVVVEAPAEALAAPLTSGSVPTVVEVIALAGPVRVAADEVVASTAPTPVAESPTVVEVIALAGPVRVTADEVVASAPSGVGADGPVVPEAPASTVDADDAGPAIEAPRVEAPVTGVEAPAPTVAAMPGKAAPATQDSAEVPGIVPEALDGDGVSAAAPEAVTVDPPVTAPPSDAEIIGGAFQPIDQPSSPAPIPETPIPEAETEWVVARALPAPADPLDEVVSDDPAEVNRLLQSSRAGSDDAMAERQAALDDRRAEVADDEAEEGDDDLLSDDPATVNAAMAAAEEAAAAAAETGSATPQDVDEGSRSTEEEPPRARQETDSTLPSPPMPIAEAPSEVVARTVADPVEAPLPVAEPVGVVAPSAPSGGVVASVDVLPEPDSAAEPSEATIHPQPIPVPVDIPAVIGEPIGEATLASLTSEMVPPDDPLPDVAHVSTAPVPLQPAPAASISPVSAAAEAPLPDADASPLTDVVEVQPPASEVAAAANGGIAGSGIGLRSPPDSPAPPGAVPEPPPPAVDSAPPPPPPADSPLPPPATRTTPATSLPMPHPTRSRAWLLLAGIVALNLAWLGYTWFTWVPKDVLEVTATTPAVSQDGFSLTWTFNLDVVDDLARPPQEVPDLDPAVAGRWRWSDRRTLVFTAEAPLPLASSFVARLPAERLRAASGFRMASPVEHRWSTLELAIAGAAVETFDRDGTTIALTFNQPVDPLVIANALQVDLPPVAAVSAASLASPSSPDLPAEVVAPTGAAVAEPSGAISAPASSTIADGAPVAPPSTGTLPTPAIPSAPAPAEESTGIAEAAPAPATEASPAVAIVAPAPAPMPVAAPAAPVVRAISTSPAATIRLLVSAPGRGPATLRLPAGVVGIGGPLGLTGTWEQSLPLRQTLTLGEAIAEVPSHGDVRVEIAVSDVHAPRDLLAPVVTVDPPLPVTISTSDRGLSLVGGFVPGQRYTISAAATWPDDPATSGHLLSAYTAASAISLEIPARPAGLWALDHGLSDGTLRLAAHAVTQATAQVLPQDGAEAVASDELVWSAGSEVPALLDGEALTRSLAPGRYRLRVTGQEAPPWEQPLVVEEVQVRPSALLAALATWGRAVLAGAQLADVPVRVVQLER